MKSQNSNRKKNLASVDRMIKVINFKLSFSRLNRTCHIDHIGQNHPQIS